MTATARKRQPIDAFIAKKAEIDAMLARLQRLSDDHFDYARRLQYAGHQYTVGSRDDAAADPSDVTPKRPARR